MRWRSQQIDLTPEEIDRLWPLTEQARPYIGRFRQTGSDRPTALFASIRRAVEEVAASHGFTNCQTAWKRDGATLSVWVQWQEEDTAP